MKKNFKYLGIVIITILFMITACKKDSEKPLGELFLGKWEMQSAYYEYYENGVKTGDLYDTFGKNEFVYEFIKDGVGNLYENGTLKNSLTWTLVGTSVTINKPGEVTKGEITINNDILTIVGSESFTANGSTYQDIRIFTFKKV